MKRIISFVILSMSSAMVSAAQPATLKDTMKAMSADLKLITAQVNVPASNADSATRADDFVALTTHAKDFTPDTITALPADQQAAAKRQYDAVLDQAIAQGTQLAQALRANDNTTAASLLTQLTQTRNDGHGQFKGN